MGQGDTIGELGGYDVAEAKAVNLNLLPSSTG